MNFEWDAEKADANLEKHDVSFRDAVTAFADPLSTTFPDPDHSEGEWRFLTIGASQNGALLVIAHTNTATPSGSSTPVASPGTSVNSMKKHKTRKPKPAAFDELRPAYDFATMKGGVRGKYVERYRAGTNLVLLEADVAAAFPTDETVNEALRTILKAAAEMSRPPSKRRRAAKS